MRGDSTRLQELDDLLTRVRAAIQRPEYRRRLLSGFDVPGGIPTLRLLRAVEVVSSDEAPSIRDVASRLALEHSTVSRSVDVAVRSGLLDKQPCERDLRRTRLQLTTQGSALLRKASRRRRELLGQVTEGWADEDVDRLVELLELLCQGFDTLEGSP
jgi:DNA-binding MarR family transcriptional regulator